MGHALTKLAFACFMMRCYTEIPRLNGLLIPEQRHFSHMVESLLGQYVTIVPANYILRSYLSWEVFGKLYTIKI